MLDWQDLFLKRKIMRENYFRTNNPEIVRKNLLQELLCNIRDCPFDDMKELVDFTFHPTGELNDQSFGNNPFFRALLAISDQLYVYDEFIQEFGFLINKNLDLVLPPSKRKKTFKHNSSEIDSIHKELIQKYDELESSGSFEEISSSMRKKEMMQISPNKALLYNLIDGRKTHFELWQLFNDANNLEENHEIISKEYINQLLRELEDDGIIQVRKYGSVSNTIIRLI